MNKSSMNGSIPYTANHFLKHPGYNYPFNHANSRTSEPISQPMNQINKLTPRALELSTAAQHLPGIVDALEGLGSCCLESCLHRCEIFLDKSDINISCKQYTRTRARRKTYQSRN